MLKLLYVPYVIFVNVFYKIRNDIGKYRPISIKGVQFGKKESLVDCYE